MGQGNKNLKRNVRPAAPALLQRIDVISNESKDSSVSLISGTVRVLYWESILSDTVSASVVFTDAGNTMTRTKKGQGHGKRRKKVSAVEGLPIVGEERVSLKFTDNNDNTISFSQSSDNNLYINKITALPTDSQTTNKSYELSLVSKEYIDNEKSRVRVCRRGEVSDHVKFILEDVLKTEKEILLDDTKEPLDYVGNNKKPFYAINKLSTKAVSAENQGLGDSAGYFFFETSEGYHFKSIDTLLSGTQKKSIIYNETPDTAGKGIPPGYDIKALTLDIENRINVQKKLQMGAYSTRSITFDPFSTQYDVQTLDAFSEEGQKKIEGEGIKLAGKRLPTPNKEFAKPGMDSEFSRTTFLLYSTGQLNMGKSEEQLNECQDENLKTRLIVNQSIMRYNQLFASQITITIPGEFSLHAGDTVFLDIPQISESENKSCGDEVNKEDGGLYIIADLCHYITAKETYTKLNLIRDSFGRDGNPTKGKTFN
jgi:hypothetical protein